MSKTTSLLVDTKAIYHALSSGEEISAKDLLNYVGADVKAKHTRVFNCINKMCEFGMTVAENEVNGRLFYSLIPSIDNKLLYNKYLSNI